MIENLRQSSQTFVLVHGAWHGGWCWHKVAALLREEGHTVSAPTVSGLGERHGLLSPEIDLGTMIADIVDHILAVELHDVRLVGHSFGGPIITGVADEIPERLAELTFLDSLWLENGQAPADLLPPDTWANRLAGARAFDDGLSLPVPPPAAFGVVDPEGVALLEQQLTSHPVASYLSPLELHNPVCNGLPARYVLCTAPPYQPVAESAVRARAAGLPVIQLVAPHDAMISEPQKTASVLLS